MLCWLDCAERSHLGAKFTKHVDNLAVSWYNAKQHTGAPLKEDNVMGLIQELFAEKNYTAAIEAVTDSVAPEERAYAARSFLQLRDYAHCQEYLLSAFNLSGGDLELEEISLDGIRVVFAEVATVSVAHVRELLAQYAESGENDTLIASTNVWTECTALIDAVGQRGDLLSSKRGSYTGVADRALTELMVQTGTVYADQGTAMADFIVNDFTADRPTATTTAAGLSALAWLMGLNGKAKNTGIVLQAGAGLLDVAISNPVGDSMRAEIAEQYKRIIDAQVKILQLSKKGVSGKDVYFLDDSSGQKQEWTNQLTKYLIQIKKVDPGFKLPGMEKSGKSGCYVATAVYGSYDCPQVWTLRRYRDQNLAKSWYGRVFIKTYYAISPTLVQWFGSTQWFKKLWRVKLDRMVAKLQGNGVESTPYEDQNW